MISIRALSGSIITALIVFGCSSSTPAPADTCSADTTVTCTTAGSTGFTCTGAAVPGDSGTCSAGTVDSNGDTPYCCYTTTSGACTADTTVTCTTAGATGETCTGGAVPPTADNCTAGTADSNGDVPYCCGNSSASTCSADSSVTGCTGGATGYSCTGTDTPDATDTSIICSDGVAGTGDTLYCCATATTPATCMADETVTGCTGQSYGFSCTGSDPPDASDPTLICSDPVTSGSDSLYCCATDTVSSTCMADDTVTGCTGNSYGFSCTGSDAPDASDTSLVCSEGVMTGSDTIYCCVDNTDATCVQDDTITCPSSGADGSFGLKCSTSADPTDPTLNCSAGTADPDGSSTDFCCTN